MISLNLLIFKMIVFNSMILWNLSHYQYFMSRTVPSREVFIPCTSLLIKLQSYLVPMHFKPIVNQIEDRRKYQLNFCKHTASENHSVSNQDMNNWWIYIVACGWSNAGSKTMFQKNFFERFIGNQPKGKMVKQYFRESAFVSYFGRVI